MEVSELDQIPEPRRRRFFKAGLYLFKALALLGGLVATACGFMLLYALWSSHSALSTGNMLFVGAVGFFWPLHRLFDRTGPEDQRKIR